MDAATLLRFGRLFGSPVRESFSFSDEVWRIRLQDGRDLVVKSVPRQSAATWRPGHPWTELVALDALGADGAPVPALLAFDLDHGWLAMEYIDGTPPWELSPGKRPTVTQQRGVSSQGAATSPGGSAAAASPGASGMAGSPGAKGEASSPGVRAGATSPSGTEASTHNSVAMPPEGPFPRLAMDLSRLEALTGANAEPLRDFITSFTSDAPALMRAVRKLLTPEAATAWDTLTARANLKAPGRLGPLDVQARNLLWYGPRRGTGHGSRQGSGQGSGHVLGQGSGEGSWHGSRQGSGQGSGHVSGQDSGQGSGHGPGRGSRRGSGQASEQSSELGSGPAWGFVFLDLASIGYEHSERRLVAYAQGVSPQVFSLLDPAAYGWYMRAYGDESTYRLLGYDFTFWGVALLRVAQGSLQVPIDTLVSMWERPRVTEGWRDADAALIDRIRLGLRPSERGM